jgi:YHS domain-containing protein
MTTSLRSLAAFVLLALAASAQAAVNTNDDGLGLKGYDPVAFFTVGEPTLGKASLVAEHDGVTYRFATAAHRRAFQAAPEKYLPAYGGYCAYGVAKGALFDVSIDTWDIIDGRLMFNFDADIKEQFEADRAALLQDAEGNWPELSQSKG